MLYQGKKLEVRMNGRAYHCALDITMDYLGGKWKAIALWYLIGRPRRFSELKRQIPEITEKMLSLQLKNLESDGLVSRKVYAEVPPRVEYALTADGKTLIPALKALAKWGRGKAQRDGKIIAVPLEATPPARRGKSAAAPAAKAKSGNAKAGKRP